MLIFPRSRDGGNPGRHIGSRIRMVLLAGALAVSGCAVTPRIPANVILRDAHNNGYVLAFDDCSETLASGGSEGRLRLWHLPDGKELAGWKAHTDSVQGIQFLNHDRELLSAAYDGTLARWTRDGKLLKRLQTPAPVTSLAVDEAGDLVITGHSDGHVRLWRLAELTLARDWQPHRGAVRAVAYDATSDQLASGGTDGRVFHWRRNEEPRPLPAPPTDAQDLAFAPDGKSLLGSGWLKLFRWQLDDGRLQVLPTPHHGFVKSISLSRDGRTLASIGRQTDSAVYLLDAATGTVLRRFQPHELCGSFVRLSPDGRYLASTSDDASVYIWDLQHPLPEQSYFSEK